MIKLEPHLKNFQDTKTFNDNASKILIDRSLVREFLKHIGREVADSPNRIEFDCPICGETASVWEGKHYPLAWSCKANACHKEQTFKNLMGLTQLCTKLKFGELFPYIAKFLGYEDSFDITRGVVEKSQNHVHGVCEAPSEVAAIDKK